MNKPSSFPAAEALEPSIKHALDEYGSRLHKMATEDVGAELVGLQFYIEHNLELLSQEWELVGTYDLLQAQLKEWNLKRQACSDEITRRRERNLLPLGEAVTKVTPELIRDVKSRVDLTEIVERAGVDLEKRGKSYVGLCPFHNDRNHPAFHVFPEGENSHFHCFTCGAHGDALTFIMRHGKRDFLAALQDLATHAGMELPRIYKNGSGRDLRTGPRQTESSNDNGTSNPIEKKESLLALANFNRTDTGNGEAFAHLFGDRVRFNRRHKHWLLWSAPRWRRDVDAEIERLAVECVRARYHAAGDIEDQIARKDAAKWAIQSESVYRLHAMLQSASTLEPIADAGDNWDANPWLLGCENGILDLCKGTLRPGLPEDRITLSTRIEFDAAATCPRWMQFLREVFVRDDLIAFIHRAVGYSLTASTAEQALFLCYGTGGNGKSVFLKMLRALLGDYAMNTPFSTFELNDRNANTNDVAALHKARLVTSSESRESARLNEARVKAMTGGDPITARFLHQEFFTFVPSFKVWLAANHKPKVDDDSYGFWRRIRLIPFTQKFDPHKEPGLENTLRGELPGILNWAVSGCLAWQSEGLQTPSIVTNATEEYRAESDPLAAFFKECCVITPTARVGAGDLYTNYKDWAVSNGEQPMKQTAFGLKVRERGFEKRAAKINGESKPAYFGIGLANQQQPR